MWLPRAVVVPALAMALSGGFAFPAWAQPDHSTCGKACVMRQYFDSGLGPNGRVLPAPGDDDFGPREASEATDVQHCRLELEVIPSSQTRNIIGTNTMTVRSLIDGLTEFTFRLRSQYAITALTVDGVNATATTPAPNSYGRTIALPHAYNAGEVFTVQIGYEGLAVRDSSFGSITFTTFGGNPAVFSFSCPYHAGAWWPVKDGDLFQPGDNSDKFTAEVWVTAPAAMTSVSNGTLRGTDALAGARNRARWQTDYPIAPYLVCIGSAVYARTDYTYTYSGGSMPISLYIVPSSNTSGNRAVWATCIDMMGAFEPVYGLYPFINEKYGIYQFPLGGMEHQTMTGQSVFSEYLTAHELGHQWWGDNVTCKTWHDAWLNEGFATYTEAIWLERKAGSSGTPALLGAMAVRRPSNYSGSVYCYDATSISSIFNSNNTYLKGAWVLHQLRHIVGDATFFAILAQYRAAYEGSAATTADFAAVASAVYGQDLSWFFQEWVMETGAPTYQVGWQPATITGQNYIRLYINQTSTGQYGVFAMPVDIRVNWPGGNQTYKVFNDAAAEHFVIPVGGAAVSILFDEFNWILSASRSPVAYVNGPPKVVQAVPSPGAALNQSIAPTSLTVTLSENVTAAASDFVVTRDGSPVPFTYSYNAANFTATLDTGPLAPGSYSVTVSDSVISAAAAIALDGEITTGTLPSGDGVPLGDAVYAFTVACPADYNGDGFVDGIDYDQFNNDFEAGNIGADINGDGFVDGIDSDLFNNGFESGC